MILGGTEVNQFAKIRTITEEKFDFMHLTQSCTSLSHKLPYLLGHLAINPSVNQCAS